VARANNVPLLKLVEALGEASTACVRLAAERAADDSWIIRALEVTTGPPPPKWEELTWEYARAVLLAFNEAGPTVAEWFAQRAIAIRGLQIDLSHLGETLGWERRESYWSGGAHEPLPWPNVEWILQRATNPGGTADELIGQEAPSFIRLEVALACLLAVDYQGWNLGGREFVVRAQDLRGRIDHVRVRPTEIQVAVSGRSLDTAVLELAGTSPGPREQLGRADDQQVVLPTADRLRDSAWLLLRSGGEWLDRRILGGAVGQGSGNGIEFEVPATTRLEALAAQGEGPTTEFKVALPDDTETSKRGVLKTVGAFANGRGGAILFGVSNEGEVLGLPMSECSPKVQDRLAGLVRSWVSPLVNFAIEVVEVEATSDRRVIILSVEPGDDVPYGVGTTVLSTSYYIRRGATSFPVAPSEVGSLVRSRSQPPRSDPFASF